MTTRLIVLTRVAFKRNDVDLPYYTQSELWKNFNLHCYGLSPLDDVHKIRRQILTKYNAHLCVDPDSRDNYLQFDHVDDLTAFQLAWS